MGMNLPRMYSNHTWDIFLIITLWFVMQPQKGRSLSTTRGLRDTTWYNRYIPLQHATTNHMGFLKLGYRGPTRGLSSPLKTTVVGAEDARRARRARHLGALGLFWPPGGYGAMAMIFLGIQFGPLSGPAKSWWFFKIPPANFGCI